ncbi:HPF/RaiA family ribosome-associated protein [Ramlibacter sp. H39-3-26]|uniref:HPF/RaiA family ribosome-associated protein n=1 Tax=Curvibacter soli TaxID=3031331 RepID=UPI0023DAADA7|nr:HPF/RaiA family ribosome-associated protein [Ramlibacter sp. H39-3-26]MDF1486303.1 HPF/RaiA family ribosome-associated protein [Ramlibacter sp. H39-3-26]
MQIQVRTDDHIQGGESLARWIEQEVAERLARFRDQLTHVDVFLSDGNADKAGDKRCVLEARLAGRQPLAANAEAATVADAFTSAADKLVRVLDTDQGRLKDRHGRDTIRAPS